MQETSAAFALQNPVLLASLAGHAFFPRVAGLRAVADFFHPEGGDTTAAALNAFTLHQIPKRHAEHHQQKDAKCRQKHG